MIGNVSARSSTQRAIGPITVRGSASALIGGTWPVFGTRPLLGFNPATPQQCAGQRMLPPESLPRPSGDPHAATITASPLLLPPGDRDASYGFLGAGWMSALRLRFRFAEHDRTCGAHPRHDRRVAPRHVVAPLFAIRRTREPARFDPVFHRERHAVQRARRFASRDRRIGRTRLVHRGVRNLNDRIELRIHRFDALQVRRNHFLRRHLFRS